MRLFFPALVVGVALSAPTLACSCWNPQSDFQAIREAAVIFRGTALAEDAVQPPQRTNCRGGFGPECAPTPTVRFRVIQLFKGLEGRDEILVTASRQDGVNCGVSFRLGQEYLVAAMGSADEGYRTSLCTMPHGRSEPAYAAYRLRTSELRKSLQAAPKNDARLRSLAEHYLRYGDWDSARTLLRDTTTPDFLVMLGEAELGASHGEAALAAFDRAQVKAPGLASARKGRTAALVHLGRTDGLGPRSDFSGITLTRTLSLANQDFSGSSFAAVQLEALEVERALLNDTDFRRAIIKRFSATGAVLRHADFRHAVVHKADLSHADAEGANFRWSSLRAVRFTNANLKAADFTAATLENVDFTGAVYDEKTVWPPGFNPKRQGAVQK